MRGPIVGSEAKSLMVVIWPVDTLTVFIVNSSKPHIRFGSFGSHRGSSTFIVITKLSVLLYGYESVR